MPNKTDAVLVLVRDVLRTFSDPMEKMLLKMFVWRLRITLIGVEDTMNSVKN